MFVGLGLRWNLEPDGVGTVFFVGRIRTAGTHPTGRPLVACLRLETFFIPALSVLSVLSVRDSNTGLSHSPGIAG